MTAALTETPYFDGNDINDGEWIDNGIHQGTDVFSLYDSQQMDASDLLTALLGNIAGINILSGSVNFIGADRSASTFSSLDLGQSLNLLTPGVLLTSGDGAPALSNTQESYSLSTGVDSEWIEYAEPQWEEYPVYDDNGDPVLDNEGNPVTDGEWIEGYWELPDNGDAQLTDIAQQAFDEAGVTYDASILEFSFTVTDTSIRSISLDVLFGSEEFPVFINSQHVDIAAVIVNDQNYAYIDGDSTKPLSIVGATADDGRFIDNTVDYYDDGFIEASETEVSADSSPLNIEYNGVTPKLTISIPLNDEDNTYHVRLGIADTGDDAYDSGLFITNFRSLTSQYEGTLVNVEANDEGSELVAPSSNTATLFVGGAGNDKMTGSTAADVYDINKGGNNTIAGSAEQLNGDTVVGFSEKDTLTVTDQQFSDENLTVTMGSAILDIDFDKNGTTDSTIRLEGDYTKGIFATSQTEDSTAINYVLGKQTPDDSLVIKEDDGDIAITDGQLVQLFGDTSGRIITIEKGAGAINLSAGSQVVLEGISSDDVRILRDGTTITVQDADANILVQMAASTQTPSYVWLDDGFAKLEADATDASLQFADVDFAMDGDLAYSNELTWLSHDDAPSDLLMGVNSDFDVV